MGSVEDDYIVKLRGLPYSTTVDDVLNFLQKVNIVNGAQGVHLTEVRPGRPSGECFVEVMGQSDIDEALKMDKENMGKRYIEVFSTDRQDMEWAMNAGEQNDNGYSTVPYLSDSLGVIKLRGLPYGCSKEEIVKFLNGLPVTSDSVHILSDASGRASGEAFVHFPDKRAAQEALKRDREKIGHRYIEIFLSSAEEARCYSPREEGGGRLRPGRGGFRSAPYERMDRFGRFPNPRGGRGGGFGGGRGGLGGGLGSAAGGLGSMGGGLGSTGGGVVTIHMRGLPFKATPQDIAFFFRPIHPTNINILFDESGRPSGEADVEFECYADAMRAMRRDKNNMDHRYIELFLTTPGSGSSNGNGPFRPRNF